VKFWSIVFGIPRDRKARVPVFAHWGSSARAASVRHTMVQCALILRAGSDRRRQAQDHVGRICRHAGAGLAYGIPACHPQFKYDIADIEIGKIWEEDQ
jgi:hypothetical protein